MNISVWVQHSLVRKEGRKLFASRIDRGVTFGFFGLSIHVGRGPWKFDWQGFDDKRFGL